MNVLHTAVRPTVLRALIVFYNPIGSEACQTTSAYYFFLNKNEMRRIKWVAVIALMTGFAACNNNNSTPGNAKVNIHLTDSPADYSKVNIDVQSISLLSADSAGSDSVIDLGAQAGVYNLLDLTNGLDTLLASQNIPAGKYSQIRVVLGTDNTLVMNGTTYPLMVPSGSSSGLKLQLNTNFTEGVTYDILLDFDAARSIVVKGNGGFNLKPVIRVSTEANSGSIKGSVNPANTESVVYAISSGNDTLSSYVDTLSGNFLIRAVPAGTYTVEIDPSSASGLSKKSVDNVSVQNGQEADAGTIDLTAK